ncbi:MAG: hypothetical protein QXQ31_08565 [Zestosphaera sp.]
MVGELRAQNWNASAVVWVEYADFSARLPTDLRLGAYDVGDKAKGFMSVLPSLVSDFGAVSDCGLRTYFSFCKKLGEPSKADKVLLLSTLDSDRSGEGLRRGEEAGRGEGSCNRGGRVCEDGGAQRLIEDIGRCRGTRQ